MKARIKTTGEEIEVMQVYEKGDSFYVRLDMLSTTEVRYHISELEFEGMELLNQSEPNYWGKTFPSVRRNGDARDIGKY